MSANMPPTTPDEVTAFWREAGPGRWFRKDEAFDADFRARFLVAHEAAAHGSLDGWALGDAAGAESALALLILLDQFPRNAFRGTARMFATDVQAVRIARAARASGFDQQIEESLRNFFYLPFMHSEALADQDRAVELTATLGEDALKYAHLHRDIILRFGRFPHRNPVLGRGTTPKEQRFLDEGGFAG